MDVSRIKEMKDLADKCSDFIKKTSTPIKRRHSEEVEKYIDRFIKFPGVSIVASILFTSSDLVVHTSIALLGTLLIMSSLLVALNTFRTEIYNSKNFYAKIIELEEPMVDFTKSLTRFSRYPNTTNEFHIQEKYNALQASYESYSNMENPTDAKTRFDKPYLHITISFYLLVIGIFLLFLSAMGCV